MHDQQRQHADRYAELPEATRELLEDEERMNRVMRGEAFFKWAETTSRYIKWSVLFILAVFMAVFALADYISRAVAWFRG